MSLQSGTLTLALVGLLAGCGDSSDHAGVLGSAHGSLLNGHVALNDGQLTLHVDGSPAAVISAAGDLSIDAHPVTIDGRQRALLQAYYRDLAAVREHGIETGKAGAATASVALQSVAAGLANGNTDQIEQRVNARADKVKAAAAKICADLASIEATQNTLALQLPAFKPYASIVTDSDVRDCRED